MDFEALRTSTLAFVEANQGWTPLIVGILAFCESLAFLSLLVPATFLLLGIGALMGSVGIPFWPVMLAGAFGAALGDWVSYEFGHYYKEGAKQMWPMRRYPALVERAERFCHRWGAGGILIGRFIGPARAVVPLIAGVFGVKRLPFQIANVTSALAWAFLMLAPGAGLLANFKG
ncbi:DedA family protein [Methylobacterium sp. 37f]|uniref:DedA family protein n=1 Tax=Methylobacterium sp. 37f TaxID=2817058 RepID=UPI001FFD94E3|nr:DedA family protein [Methylobacterium sp. 37f]MCK2053143.1 DedA family protein [Methylobacterium sp. 37f]